MKALVEHWLCQNWSLSVCLGVPKRYSNDTYMTVNLIGWKQLAQNWPTLQDTKVSLISSEDTAISLIAFK